MSEQQGGVKLGGTIPIGLVTTGVIIVGVGLLIAKVLIPAFSGIGNIFAGGGQSEKQQGGQQADVEAQRAKAEAEIQRALAETQRAENAAKDAESKGAQVAAEQSRADAEQTRANAEIERANAEKLRAEAEKSREYNKRLLIESGQAQYLDDLEGGGNTASREITDKDVTTTTQKETNTKTSNQTPSGQTGTVIKEIPDQGQQSYYDPNKDPLATALDKANNKTTSKTNKTRFLDSREPRVFVDNSLKTKPNITGVVVTEGSRGTGDFTIYEKPARTINDILKENPKLTASQARDILLARGTSTKADLQSLAKAAKTFDFGTNTGGGRTPLNKDKGGDITNLKGGEKGVADLELKRIQDEKLKQEEAKALKTLAGGK